MNFKTLSHYIQASRPQTLLVSLSVWTAGAALVLKEALSFHLCLHLVILFCMITLQIAVNYFNDALDFQNKKDSPFRLGPARMVQEGFIHAAPMMRAAVFMLILAALSGAYLIFNGGGVFILGIGVLGILSSYFYSAKSFSIADRGLSEIFVFLFFGLLAVTGIFYLGQNPQEFFMNPLPFLSAESFIIGSQMGFLSVSLLLINHLRDRREDEQSSKKTLVVRLGRNFGLLELLFSIALPYLMGVYFFSQENLSSFLWPFLILPLHLFIFFKIKKDKEGPSYNFYLGGAALAQFLFSLTLSLSLIYF